jgi:hypothetical protein
MVYTNKHGTVDGFLFLDMTSFGHDASRRTKRHPRGQGVDMNYYTFVLPSIDGYM